MQKVVFSISKVNRDEKLTGVGYLIDGNLLVPALSSKGNPYIKIIILSFLLYALYSIKTIVYIFFSFQLL